MEWNSGLEYWNATPTPAFMFMCHAYPPCRTFHLAKVAGSLVRLIQHSAFLQSGEPDSSLASHTTFDSILYDFTIDMISLTNDIPGMPLVSVVKDKPHGRFAYSLALSSKTRAKTSLA